MTKRFVFSLMVGVFLTACSGDASAPRTPRAEMVSVVSGTPQIAQAGQPLPAPLVVRVTDVNDQPVSNAVVFFTIKKGGGQLSTAADTTDASGNASATWTVGSSMGAGQVEARAEFVTARVNFDVTINAGPLAKILQSTNAIGSTASGFETGDSIGIKLTDNFGNPIAGQAVTFSVVAGGGTVSPAVRTSGTDGIARTSWTVGSPGGQTLRAAAGALNVDVNANAVSCSEFNLAVGEVQSLNPAEVACAVLDGKAQRYLVTIVNSANSPVTSVAYKGRGLMGTTLSPLASASPPTTSSIAEPALFRMTNEEMEESLTRGREHAMILEKNLELLQRFGPQAHAALRSSSPAAALRVPPSVGDLIPMKLPDITVNGCTTFTPVVARVVYVGSKGIMLEDTETPLKGQADTLYQRIGREFDNVIFPILNTNFGNPLARDAQLNNDGAVYMLFSTKVTTMGTGLILGFVSTADFLPNCPSSNSAEVFYARAPTVLGTTSNEPTSNWEFTRAIASTIIHEAKHLTSFASKSAQPGFSGNQPAQDAWLEESSAEIAQELLSRVTLTSTAKSNLGYASTLAGEVRPSTGMPINMFNAFRWLYTYFSNPEALSLVGSAGPGDVTFYGSGWAFLRWVIDTYATSESAFLTAMTRDISHFGVANIENITGKSFQQLLGEFSLALALDDYPGFTPTNPKYSFPSWNLRSIFAGMSADFPNSFPVPAPLNLRQYGFGKFTVAATNVRGGGFSVLEVAGTQANKQLLEFRGDNGKVFPAEMRVNIVRIQ